MHLDRTSRLLMGQHINKHCYTTEAHILAYMYPSPFTLLHTKEHSNWEAGGK